MGAAGNERPCAVSDRKCQGSFGGVKPLWLTLDDDCEIGDNQSGWRLLRRSALTPIAKVDEAEAHESAFLVIRKI